MKIKVRLLNQLLIQVELMGNIQLNEHILLENVLNVPKFELNLVSVSQLTTKRVLKAFFTMIMPL